MRNKTIGCTYLTSTPTFHVFGNIVVLGNNLFGKKIKINKNYFDGTDIDGEFHYSIVVNSDTKITADNDNVVPIKFTSSSLSVLQLGQESS